MYYYVTVTRVSGEKYWQIGSKRPSIKTICESKALTHFTVMQVEPIRFQPHKTGQCMLSKKVRLAFVCLTQGLFFPGLVIYNIAPGF